MDDHLNVWIIHVTKVSERQGERLPIILIVLIYFWIQVNFEACKYQYYMGTVIVQRRYLDKTKYGIEFQFIVGFGVNQFSLPGECVSRRKKCGNTINVFRLSFITGHQSPVKAQAIEIGFKDMYVH